MHSWIYKNYVLFHSITLQNLSNQSCKRQQIQKCIGYVIVLLTTTYLLILPIILDTYTLKNNSEIK